MRRIVVAAAVVALTAAMSASAKDKDDKKKEDAARDEAAVVQTAPADSPLAVEASGYAAYQADVAALGKAPFASEAELDKGLAAIESHRPEDLSRSWMAYAALVAAQSPEFVDGVRQTAEYYGRDAVLKGLGNDPAYAGQMQGAEAARQAVAAAAKADVEALRAAGAAMKQQAYALQKQDWASAKTARAKDRLAKLDKTAPPEAPASVVAALAAPGAVGSEAVDKKAKKKKKDKDAAAAPALSPAQASFWAALPLSRAPAADPSAAPMDLAANPVRKNVLDQVVTLAAFVALGEAGSSNRGALDPLLEQADAKQCLTMARMTYHQCIAAAHFRNEDPFCIAEHGMTDVGDCVEKVLASTPPKTDAKIAAETQEASAGE